MRRVLVGAWVVMGCAKDDAGLPSWANPGDGDTSESGDEVSTVERSAFPMAEEVYGGGEPRWTVATTATGLMCSDSEVELTLIRSMDEELEAAFVWMWDPTTWTVRVAEWAERIEVVNDGDRVRTTFE